MNRRVVKKQANRTYGSGLLLVLGLLLSWLYYGAIGPDRIGAGGALQPGNPHVQFFVWIPSALGALGLGSWALRMTLFAGKDVDTLPGAILALGILLACAIVIAGAL